MMLLTREQLHHGLRQLVARLRESGTSASLSIVGGAALALRYYDRESTADIDGRVTGDGVALEKAVQDVAAENGWQADWLNTSAAQFIPSIGVAPEWELLYDDGEIVIQVGSAETLLAMKLHANRPGRDDEDLAVLLAIVGLGALGAIDDFYGSYYPGDSLSNRAVRMIENILRVGLPERPLPPPPPVF